MADIKSSGDNLSADQLAACRLAFKEQARLLLNGFLFKDPRQTGKEIEAFLNAAFDKGLEAGKERCGCLKLRTALETIEWAEKALSNNWAKKDMLSTLRVQMKSLGILHD